MPQDAQSREARYGEKMIEVKLRFFTDNIAPRGRIIPKHALTSGMVRMESNSLHEIAAMDPVPFNSLLQIGATIEKVLIAHGVVLHPSRKMKKYLKDRPPQST
jgi:hypothetical protein